jgi:Flp pilus assembly protein TadD
MSKFLLSLLMACAPAFAADTGDTTPAPTAPDKLATARAHIKASRWADAVAELKKVNDTRSGDWNNLMGFAHRKLSPPDLAAAERHYDAALKIAPAHRGALEYSGELYLMKGELPRAEQRLAELARVCAGPCEEQADLKRSIDRFKANGNKYVAEAR